MQISLSFFLLILLDVCNLLNYSINFLEDFSVVHDADLVLVTKYVIYIVFELLSTNGTNHVIGSRSRLLNTLGMLLFLGLLPLRI